MVRVAVDVMGGDKAPDEILKGCWQAAPLLEDKDVVYLVGDQQISKSALDAADLPTEKKRQYQIVHTTEVVLMDDSPVDAIRKKTDSSMAVICRMVGKGEADACVSAGNTGAQVAASQLRMRLIPGVQRPGIAVVLPTFHGPCVVCDVGANTEPKPKHLMQYGIMASAYAHDILGIDNPRVAMLSIGEEASKGTPTVKEARKMMREEPQINFIGNIEGKDVFKGAAEVVVADGFSGNILLKFVEGMSEGIFQTILAELQEEAPHLLEQFKPIMKKLYARHDWQEYGGAPLLGVGGYSLICHGRSEARAIKNAIRVAKELVRSGVNDKIAQRIEKSHFVEDE